MESGCVQARWIPQLAAFVFFAFSTQALKAWPIPRGWELSIGLAEWGHWLALLALLLIPLLRCFRAKAWLALACGLLALPVLGAWRSDEGFSWLRLARGWAPGRAPETFSVPGGQALDLYRPTTSGAHPLVLVVHGGSWARGSRKDFAALNHLLVERGMVVASLDYRLAPQHRFPEANLDLDAAHDWLLSRASELGIDPRRTLWLGRSAGAHLALLQAYQRRPSRAVVAFYPPTDLLWSYQHPSNPRVLDSCAAIRDFLGGPPEQLPLAYTQSSPLLEGRPVPTLMLHGLKDDLVFPEQSRRLARRLQGEGVAFELLEIPWANHGCDINLAGPSGQLTTLAVLRFLQRWL